MQLSVEVFGDLIGTLAIVALLLVAYGAVMRSSKQRWRAHGILGMLFGAAAVLADYSERVSAGGRPRPKRMDAAKSSWVPGTHLIVLGC